MKKLIALALALTLPALTQLSASPAMARQSAGTCGGDYYVNSRGNCVHRPMRSNAPPAGATARCRDGTYSFSQSRRGTCSHHGGVAMWLG